MMKWRYPKTRTRHSHFHSATDGWQVVYTGFILILLCFFIMLTSFASLENSKITRFAKSFSRAVSVFNGGSAIEEGETMFHSRALVIHKEDPMALLFKQVKSLGRQNNLSDIHIQKSRHGVVMTLADRMLFESGDAALTQSAYALLDKIISVLKAISVEVEIIGHTDDHPIQTEKYPSNWELSTTRAVNVLRYLVLNGGLNAERISAVGQSQYHPRVPNNSSLNRAMNRRVEIIIKPVGI